MRTLTLTPEQPREHANRQILEHPGEHVNTPAAEGLDEHAKIENLQEQDHAAFRSLCNAPSKDRTPPLPGPERPPLVLRDRRKPLARRGTKFKPSKSCDTSGQDCVVFRRLRRKHNHDVLPRSWHLDGKARGA